MAISRVQGKFGSAASSATASVTLTAAVGAHNFLCVSVQCINAGLETPTVSDDKGDLYTGPVDSVFDATHPYQVSTFLLSNVTTAPQTFTVTWPGVRTNPAIWVDEFAGLGELATLNAHAINNQHLPAGTTDAITSGSVTTNRNGCLIWGPISAYNGTQTRATGTGYSVGIDDGTGVGGTEYKVQSTAGSVAVTESIVSGTADDYITALLAVAPVFPSFAFDEEARRPRNRVAYRARQATLADEFLKNPTQFPAPAWVQDPDYFPRRSRAWRSHPEPIREEFLKNPTQFPAPAWVQDPDYFQRRLRAWRSHPEPPREEFLKNPTQTVFANWAFDEPRWRGISRPLRQPANSQPSDDMAPPAAAAVAAPYSDDEARRPARRSPWSPALRTDAIEGLPFTAATPANWPDAEQTTRVWRRSVQARAAQDEFLFKPTPTQIVSFLVSGTSWTVPSDWSSTNTIEAIGGGGAGAGQTIAGSGGGGGGGEYAAIANFSASPGDIIPISIGAGGVGTVNTVGQNGGTTRFNTTTLIAVGGGGGDSGTVGTGGAGGSSGTGTTLSDGGQGGSIPPSGSSTAGGGGAGGPGGVGASGGNGVSGGFPNAGSGGGGANGGGGAGSAGNATTSGGQGGSSISVNNQVGQAGGSGASGAADAQSGSQGSGGGGGKGGRDTAAGAGGNGTEWDSLHGSGGGGGGGATDGTGAAGGSGGLYGGGGGGYGFASGKAGDGAQGIIVITYTSLAFSSVIPVDDQRPRTSVRGLRVRAQSDDMAGLNFTAVAAPTGYYDEEAHRLQRRISIPARAEQDEFLFNPTQISFASWGFDEETHRLERRVFHRLVQQDDPLGTVQLVGVPWAFEEEARRLQRRIFHRLIQQEDPLGLAQLVGVPWGLEEEPQRAVQRRRAWRAFTEPLREEFLNNPTQTVFASWGFDEEGHRLERRVFHRLTQQDDPLGLVQLVGVPWGYEEEPQHPVPRRRAWRSYAEPLREEFLLNPTQTVFAGWGFEEEIRRLQRRPFHRLTQQDDPLGIVQLVGVPWAFEEEAHRLQRGVFHRLIQQEDPLGIVRLIIAPWGFEEEAHRLKYLPGWHAHPAPADNEGLPFTAVATSSKWADIEQYIIPRHRPARLARIAPDEFLKLGAQQAALVNWAFDEENHRMWRRPAWHASPQADEFIKNPTQTVFARWGFEEEAHRLQRRLFPRLVQQDDPLGVMQLVGVPWGFEEEAHRLDRRLFHRLTAQDDHLGIVQVVAAPWGFEAEARRAAQRIQRARAASEEWIAAPPLGTPWGWEIDARRALRGLRFQRAQIDEALLFTAAKRQDWADIEQSARIIRLAAFRRLQTEDILTQIVRPATTAPWGWEAEANRARLRAAIRSAGEQNEVLFTAATAAARQFWSDIEQGARVPRPRRFQNQFDWYADLFLLRPFLGDPAAQYVLLLSGRADYVAQAPASYYSALASGASYVVTDQALRGSLIAMPKIFEDLPPVAPTQRQTCAIDFGKFLPAGVTLTGLPSVRMTVRSGTDSTPGSRLSPGPIVGTASPFVGGTGRDSTAVIFQVSGCLDGVTYVIEVYCNRTDGDIAEAWTRLPCIAPS